MSRIRYEYIIPCSAEVEARTIEYASKLPVIPAGSGYSYRITVTNMYGDFYVVLLHDQLSDKGFCIAYSDINYDMDILQDLQRFFNEIMPILADIQDAFRPQPIPIRNEILYHLDWLKITVIEDTFLESTMTICIPGKKLSLRTHLGV